MKRSLILIATLLLSATCLRAQEQTARGLDGSPQQKATIEGKVTLPNGNPAFPVYLQLEFEAAGGMVKSASTDSSGDFSFSGAIIGQNYMVTGAVDGFQPINKLVMVTGDFTYVTITLVPLPGKKAAAGIVKLNKRDSIPAKAQEQFDKGLKSMDQGKASDAEKDFQNAIKIDPKLAPAFLRLSVIYADQKHFPEAEKAIHRAMAIDKDSPENYAYYGYLYMKEGQPEKAQQSFEKSVHIAPNDWFAQLEMGRLLYNQQSYPGALPHLEIAHKLHPALASANLLLYDDLIRLGRDKEALAELDDFVARFPKSKEATQMRKVRPTLAAAAANQR